MDLSRVGYMESSKIRRLACHTQPKQLRIISLEEQLKMAIKASLYSLSGVDLHKRCWPNYNNFKIHVYRPPAQNFRQQRQIITLSSPPPSSSSPNSLNKQLQNQDL